MFIGSSGVLFGFAESIRDGSRHRAICVSAAFFSSSVSMAISAFVKPAKPSIQRFASFKKSAPATARHALVSWVSGSMNLSSMYSR